VIKINATQFCDAATQSLCCRTVESKIKTMTRFLLIRHAATDAVGKHLSGRMPGIRLNEEGSVQARELAQRLVGLPLRAIYCSPVERAVQTAEPIAKVLQLEPIRCDDFQELDFGEWTGESFESLAGKKEFSLFNSFRSNTPIPGGEMMLEAQTRIITGLQRLSVQHRDQTVAVVSHSDLIRAALAYYLGVSLDLFQRLEISPASVSVVEVYEETVRVLLVNDIGGLKF
jgi:probable phosphoglycerate mutase